MADKDKQTNDKEWTPMTAKKVSHRLSCKPSQRKGKEVQMTPKSKSVMSAVLAHISGDMRKPL